MSRSEAVQFALCVAETFQRTVGRPLEPAMPCSPAPPDGCPHCTRPVTHVHRLHGKHANRYLHPVGAPCVVTDEARRMLARMPSELVGLTKKRVQADTIDALTQSRTA